MRRRGTEHASRRRFVPSVDPVELERVDTRLARLGRGLGGLRLRVGEGLLRLEELGGVKALGFPTLESYGREALGRAGRWCADLRALARRLAELPLLRAALVEGRVSCSMIELVVRVVTPEDEAAWVARAERMTVRAMRALLAERRVTAGEDEDARAPRVTLSVGVDRLEAWGFEKARLMVEAVGAGRGDQAIEAILAEGLGEILATHPDIDLPGTLAGSHDDDARAWAAELRALRETAEAARESLCAVDSAPVIELEPEEIWPDGIVEVDRRLRGLCQELAWRDLEIAALADQVMRLSIWQILGYANFDHYCRERVGLAPSGVAARVALGRRIGSLPAIGDALGLGRIGYEAASAIARVAGPETVEAWIERATRRTVKQLHEEIDAIEMIARADGIEVDGLPPPDEVELEEVRDLERRVIAEVVGHDAQDDAGGVDRAESQMSGTDLPRTTMRLRVSEDTARFWRALEGVHAGLGDDRSFVVFLVGAVMKSWRGAVVAEMAYSDVYLRDRWRCASPVCRRHSVTPHHIRFRSRGGGEERGNILSLCEICHLELVHGGRLRVQGLAPDGLEWRALGWAA